MSGSQGQGGLFGQAWALAAMAAGLLSALAALWAMRGMPLGGLLMWLSPLPLFAAGAAFGPKVAAAAVAIAAMVVVLASSAMGVLLYLGMFGLPVALILALAMLPEPGRLRLGAPLALLGLWPLAMLGLLALLVGDLDAALREAVDDGLRRMGVEAPAGMIDQIAQVKAAAAGFWFALLMLGNGFAGHRLAGGLALAPLPGPEEVRLPGWYGPLPAVGLAGWLLLGGVFWLSALLLLLLPFFVLGVVGVHRRLRGRAGRVAFLAGFYVLMLLFLQFMAPLMVGVGLFDQFRRRAAPPSPT